MFTKNLLRQTEFGKRLSDIQLDAVYPILSRNTFSREYKQGDIVRQFGTQQNYIMLITKGVVKSYNFTRRGERIFFYYFSTGSTIGLLSCMSPTEVSMAEDIADKDTSMICIPKSNFQEACRLIPSFESILFHTVCDLAQRQIEITILSRCKYAKDRLCLYLLHEYSLHHSTVIPFHFTIESLANYLSLTRSVLSKELHSLEDEGVIELRKKEILIKDLEKLKDYV